MLTVELYKADRRIKRKIGQPEGRRLVSKTDYETDNKEYLAKLIEKAHPASKGYSFKIEETYVTVVNSMTGKEVKERYDTPYYCSVSSESYWAM